MALLRLGLALGLDRPRGGSPQFDFAAGVLPPGATLARAGPASCVGPDRRIVVRAADAARFEHDPVTGRLLGLLVESAATNRAVRVTDLGGPAWTPFNGVVRAGTVAGIAPDGGDATRIAFGIAGGADIAEAAALYQELDTAEVGGPWTASFWIRALAETTSVRIGLYPGTVPVASSGDATVNADRWTRVWVSATIVDQVINFSIRNNVAGTSGDVLAWGAQFEPGVVPTSFIATDAGPATRAADVLRLDWGRLGVRDGPVMLRLCFAGGPDTAPVTADVAATIVAGIATVPPQPRPLTAVRLA